MTLYWIHPRALAVRFWRENILSWRDAVGGMSMSATTSPWGSGDLAIGGAALGE